MIRLEGRNFGDVPLTIEMKLEVVGLSELGRRDHRRGALREDREGPRHRRPDHRPERLLHEVAPVQFTDEMAREMVEQFIVGTGEGANADWTAFFDSLRARGASLRTWTGRVLTDPAPTPSGERTSFLYPGPGSSRTRGHRAAPRASRSWRPPGLPSPYS